MGGARHTKDGRRQLIQGTLALAGTVVAKTGVAATPCDVLPVTLSRYEFACDARAALTNIASSQTKRARAKLRALQSKEYAL